VRNVPGRAQGSHHHSVWPPVRVRGMCGGAEEGEAGPRVPYLLQEPIKATFKVCRESNRLRISRAVLNVSA
jgi:hypothetical protein